MLSISGLTPSDGRDAEFWAVYHCSFGHQVPCHMLVAPHVLVGAMRDQSDEARRRAQTFNRRGFGEVAVCGARFGLDPDVDARGGEGFSVRLSGGAKGNSVGVQEMRRCGCHLGCHDREKWRGWMGIEPTQDASTAPPQTVLKIAGGSVKGSALTSTA